jgi:hypothetical protein
MLPKLLILTVVMVDSVLAVVIVDSVLAVVTVYSVLAVVIVDSVLVGESKNNALNEKDAAKTVDTDSGHSR